jgi:hypothetical protein
MRHVESDAKGGLPMNSFDYWKKVTILQLRFHGRWTASQSFKISEAVYCFWEQILISVPCFNVTQILVHPVTCWETSDSISDKIIGYTQWGTLDFESNWKLLHAKYMCIFQCSCCLGNVTKSEFLRSWYVVVQMLFIFPWHRKIVAEYVIFKEKGNVMNSSATVTFLDMNYENI